MPRDRIWDADRLVLYLPAATQTLDAIDGSRRAEITNAAEKFLSSPESAWDKRPEDYIWHIRDLGTKTRAFATWCQNGAIECEAFIVHDIYKKDNEDEYWDDVDGYCEAGERYDEMFASLSETEYEEWKQSIADRDGFRAIFSR